MSELEFKDYKELNKTFEFDKEKATILAEAMTEKIMLEKRTRYLEQLLLQNKKISKFLWTTYEGKVIAIHDIKDDHLKNILNHIVSLGGTISPQIKAEAVSRGFEIPEETTSDRAMKYLNYGRDIDGDIIDMDEEDVEN